MMVFDLRDLAIYAANMSGNEADLMMRCFRQIAQTSALSAHIPDGETAAHYRTFEYGWMLARLSRARTALLGGEGEAAHFPPRSENKPEAPETDAGDQNVEVTRAGPVESESVRDEIIRNYLRLCALELGAQPTDLELIEERQADATIWRVRRQR